MGVIFWSVKKLLSFWSLSFSLSQISFFLYFFVKKMQLRMPCRLFKKSAPFMPPIVIWWAISLSHSLFYLWQSECVWLLRWIDTYYWHSLFISLFHSFTKILDSLFLCTINFVTKVLPQNDKFLLISNQFHKIMNFFFAKLKFLSLFCMCVLIIFTNRHFLMLVLLRRALFDCLRSIFQQALYIYNLSFMGI